MTTRKLEKAEWQEIFDKLSKRLGRKQAKIEVIGLALGNQVEAEWLPLIGIVYDHKDDVAEVALEGLDHLIHKPREIRIDEDDGVLGRLEIVDADGIRQIIKLRRDPELAHRTAPQQ